MKPPGQTPQNAKIGREVTDRPLPDSGVSGSARYVDRQPLAEGGGAILETARDVVLGREVVLKTLLPKFRSDENMRRRFLREARVVAMIQHPATPPIYDLGLDENGTPFFSMKRIDGSDFRSILSAASSQHPDALAFRSVEARLEVVIAVGQALAFSHKLGVVHRDVKPSNILVGSFGEVMLMDWGVAKVLGDPEGQPYWQQGTLPLELDRVSADPENLELTQAGLTFGTPQYMSPEQARGETDVDGRADVFSLGVVLFEALTLQRLFQGTDRKTVLEQVSSQPIPELQLPSGQSKQQSVPPELDAICRKALQRPRERRYQSMGAFVADLNRFRHSEPVSVMDYSAWQRFLFSLRNR